MDAGANKELWSLVGQAAPPQHALLLEPVVVMTGQEKLTSGMEDGII